MGSDFPLHTLRLSLLPAPPALFTLHAPHSVSHKNYKKIPLLPCIWQTYGYNIRKVFAGIFTPYFLKGTIMRHLSLRISCLFVFAIGMSCSQMTCSQLSFAQSGSGIAPDIVNYRNVNYQQYQQGIVVASTNTVQGVLLSDDQGFGKPIPGMKLTIFGGDGFVATIVTNENGEFLFDNAQVGTYTVVMENGAEMSSLNFRVTAYDPNTASLGPNTGVNNRLVLVTDGNGVLRFAATRGSLAAAAPAYAGVAAAGGGMGGAMPVAGLLGIAGLASGIAALATSDNDDHRSIPVSQGAPSSR